eukprot:scaffold7673_cov258-Pinguiococcus_pyrenoidosus.AAC.5
MSCVARPSIRTREQEQQASSGGCLANLERRQSGPDTAMVRCRRPIFLSCRPVCSAAGIFPGTVRRISVNCEATATIAQVVRRAPIPLHSPSRRLSARPSLGRLALRTPPWPPPRRRTPRRRSPCSSHPLRGPTGRPKEARGFFICSAPYHLDARQAAVLLEKLLDVRLARVEVQVGHEESEALLAAAAAADLAAVDDVAADARGLLAGVGDHAVAVAEVVELVAGLEPRVATHAALDAPAFGPQHLRRHRLLLADELHHRAVRQVQLLRRIHRHGLSGVAEVVNRGAHASDTARHLKAEANGSNDAHARGQLIGKGT